MLSIDSAAAAKRAAHTALLNIGLLLRWLVVGGINFEQRPRQPMVIKVHHQQLEGTKIKLLPCSNRLFFKLSVGDTDSFKSFKFNQS